MVQMRASVCHCRHHLRAFAVSRWKTLETNYPEKLEFLVKGVDGENSKIREALGRNVRIMDEDDIFLLMTGETSS